jgi:hypothetical protein
MTRLPSKLMIIRIIVLIICATNYNSILAQSNGNYKITKPDYKTISDHNLLIFNNNFCFVIDYLPDFSHTVLKYCYDGKVLGDFKTIDTAGFSPYGGNLFFYSSEKYNDYFIIWETKNEYRSEIKLLYCNQKIITQIGPLPIYKICNNCSEIEYPVEKLILSGDSQFFEIRFLDPVTLILDNNITKDYRPDELMIKIKKSSSKMKIEYIVKPH